MSLLLAIAASAQAAAPVWVETGTDPRGIVAAFDPASVTRLGTDRRRVRMRLISPEPMSSGLVTAIVTTEVDCAGHSFTVIRNEAFDGAGALMLAEDVPPPQRRTYSLVAGSAEAVMEARVCAAPAQ